MLVVIPDNDRAPVINYRRELADHFDKNGFCILPDWLIQYLPLIGHPVDRQTFLEITALLNLPPESETENVIQNVLINQIIMLIRMKRETIVVL